MQIGREQLSVGVIGGGIGGLGAALSLLQAGFDVHVYERAHALSEVGAGIQVSPNASRVLHGLGLGDDLARMGVRPLAFHQRRWDDGRTLLRAPLGDVMVEAFGFPHYQTHRADLLATLVGALPAERLHVGHRFRSLSDHGDRSRSRSTTARSPTSTCWSAPTASTRTCAPRCSGPRTRSSPAAPPTAGSCRPSACATSSSR